MSSKSSVGNVERVDYTHKNWTKAKLIELIYEREAELKERRRENFDLSIQLEACERALEYERGRVVQYQYIHKLLTNVPSPSAYVAKIHKHGEDMPF